MFPSTSSRETLRFSGNKIHCSPRDQSLSVYCWMLGDPHFFFQIPSFSDSLHYTKKNIYMYVGRFNYFSYTIQIGSNWYMDTGVHELKVAFLRLILPDLKT